MKFIFNGRIRQVILSCVDYCCMIFSCFFGLFVFAFAGLINFSKPLFYGQILPGMLIYSAVIVLFLWVFKVYKTIWRYARLRDFFGCVAGIIVGTGIYGVTLKAFEVYVEPL